MANWKLVVGTPLDYASHDNKSFRQYAFDGLGLEPLGTLIARFIVKGCITRLSISNNNFRYSNFCSTRIQPEKPTQSSGFSAVHLTVLSGRVRAIANSKVEASS